MVHFTAKSRNLLSYIIILLTCTILIKANPNGEESTLDYMQSIYPSRGMADSVFHFTNKMNMITENLTSLDEIPIEILTDAPYQQLHPALQQRMMLGEAMYQHFPTLEEQCSPGRVSPQLEGACQYPGHLPALGKYV